MSLKIKLKPHDKIIVNGAVIAADDKPAVITFLNNARILRQDDILLDSQIRDAMVADDGNYYNDSWLYYLIQLIYIDPENSAEVQPQLESTVTLLCNEYPEKMDEINEILELMVQGHFFKALKACKKTFPDCLAPKGKMSPPLESDTHHAESSTAI